MLCGVLPSRQVFLIAGCMVLFCAILFISAQCRIDREETFHALALLHARRQLALESHPPLAYLLAAQIPETQHGWTPLRCGRAMGEWLLSCSAALAYWYRIERQRNAGPCPEIMVALAALCTSSYADLVVIGTFCYICRLRPLVSKIADRKVSLLNSISRSFLGVGAAALAQVLTTALGFGLLFPFSELSYGGNHNLQFLSVHTRRSLRTRSSPCDGIMSPQTNEIFTGTPYSLFLPNAGFLWSDRLVWSQHSFTWVDADELLEEMMSYDAGQAGRSYSQPGVDIASIGHRAIAYDPVGRYAPWALQVSGDEVSTGGSPSAGEQRAAVNMEHVLLRNLDTSEYLSVQPNRPSIFGTTHGEINTSISDDRDRFQIRYVGRRKSHHESKHNS